METFLPRFVESLFKSGHYRTALGLGIALVGFWAIGRAAFFMASFFRALLDLQRQKEAALMSSLNAAQQHSRDNEDRLIGLVDRNTKVIEALSVNMTMQTQSLGELRVENHSAHEEILRDLSNLRGGIGQ